jgi:proline iminopeptidase
MTEFFDPKVYRVVLFDQRGAGKSTPPAELRNNTSQHLVADIEKVREHLGIDCWHLVFGGSWGSTLALLYSQTHPDRVRSIVLRGIFTVTKAELEWSFASSGAIRMFPDAFEDFLNFLPAAERNDPVSAYYSRLTSDDHQERLKAARAWNLLELKQSFLLPSEDHLKSLEDDRWCLAHARIEAHYFKHAAWLEEGQLIKKQNIDRIRRIPSKCILTQIVCTPS